MSTDSGVAQRPRAVVALVELRGSIAEPVRRGEYTLQQDSGDDSTGAATRWRWRRVHARRLGAFRILHR